MHEDMRTLLNAYMDGELHGKRLNELKSHLATCETCRKELKELQLVSDLLQAAPTPEFMPAERFASNLALSLPRRSLQERPSKTVSLVGWLVPTGLLGAWFFVQTLFTLTNAITALQIDRPARNGCHRPGRRSGNPLVCNRRQSVWQPGGRSAEHAFSAEFAEHFQREPGGRVPLAGADRLVVLGLVVHLVASAPPKASKYKDRRAITKRFISGNREILQSVQGSCRNYHQKEK